MKKALLIVNLGTPDSMNPKDVGNYLTEFLLDKHVIDIAYLLRQFLVRALIVPKRKYASAEKYKTIWRPDGSPLLVYTNKLSQKLDKKLDEYDVYYSMRYGKHSIKEVLNKIKGYSEILVLPLYPQDTKSSYLTAQEEVLKHAKKIKILSSIQFVQPFYDQDFYIDSWATKIKRETQESDIDFFLFSYHGIPQHHIPNTCISDNTPCNKNADISSCYRAQCYATTDLIAKKLGLKKEQFQTSFQSRLGRRPWIKPYTDLVIKDLKRNNIKNIAVFSPSFITDCLETLQEIGIELKDDFEKKSTDHHLKFISCLNDEDHFVERLSHYITSRPS